MLRNLNIEQRETAFEGRRFGDTGEYELLRGTFEIALDPHDRQVRTIVDIDRVPPQFDGHVTCNCDLAIFRPADPTKGNRWLFYDLPNRGEQRVFTRINRARGGEGKSGFAADSGDGLLFRKGFTLVLSGWQANIPNGDEFLSARYPVAMKDGDPLRATTREEWTDTGSDPRFRRSLSYSVALGEEDTAILTVRQNAGDARETPPDLEWMFDGCDTIVIDRPTGYDSGAIYELIYTAVGSPIQGMAFASVRDLISFLRFERRDENPLIESGRTLPRFAHLLGVSQPGRAARDFLWDGWNRDEMGRRVFDAATVVVAGARRAWVNGRFAQAGRFSRQHEDHDFPGDQFPFAYAPQRDPVTGQEDDILARARADSVDISILHFDTESELWSARGSLLRDDGAGHDLSMPDNVHLFMASGIQHAPALPPFEDMSNMAVNPIDYSMMLRALVLALIRHVETGTPMPESCYPSFTDGTLVSLEAYRAKFPAIPGVAAPDRLNAFHRMDHSHVPPIAGEAWPIFVASADADGIAQGGLKHPFVKWPIGTSTGWNLRTDGHAPAEINSIFGGFVPFALTEDERVAAADPRPSIEARYGDHANWKRHIAETTGGMVEAGYLLAEDGAEILRIADLLADVFAGKCEDYKLLKLA